MNWGGLVRSLQPEIMGLAGALLLILVVWLVVRAIIGRSAAGLAHARLRAWADRGASLLALVIVGGMLWHVIADNLTDHIAANVGRVRVDQGVPLRLVGVQVSNMKPDESVVEPQVAHKAVEARTAAIKTLTDFLDQDPTGTRKMVYRMQVLQELTRTANANGHNTIFLTDLGGPGAGVLPLPAGR